VLRDTQALACLLLGRDGFAGLSNGAIWGYIGLLLASFCEELFAGARAAAVCCAAITKAEAAGNINVTSSRGSLSPSVCVYATEGDKGRVYANVLHGKGLAFTWPERIR